MKSRDVARIEMPQALRREVRLLGEVLGQVLRNTAVRRGDEVIEPFLR